MCGCCVGGESEKVQIVQRRSDGCAVIARDFVQRL